ncbi:IS110 family transposase (plasmid) [Bradyrhizobium sp. CCGUVB1N3]|uniref:IS110 family transposase n=1 Tax=Bradyrhizobium sp. CCGUVB1N3 TaxID=2949629 RepID=UPI0020B2042D|nr:IS110 family transposase [Bradyrhizobium sp. CCGUVB1N3]MCP3477737.1 IS110 family transposase [Bradyrhizobium sp. CCGUVB1N3]
MENVTIIGIDLAKRTFQLHGAGADGSVIFRKKLSRERVLGFLDSQPKCLVAMESCATSHYWGGEIAKLGHEVRLIPPIYVKPFVKRQKNDAADAEAIVEAASRPTMHFVAVKTEAQQAQSMVFRTRDILVGQRTQMINALRGHLAEYGVIAPQGTVHVHRLEQVIEDPKFGLPEQVRDLSRLYLDQITMYDDKIKALEKIIRERAKQDEDVTRLMTIPGIGVITAMAIQAFAPPMEVFRSGRDFAAWLGIVPRQKSTGGKPKLGKTSKMGQRDIRRLLILGATSVVNWAGRTGVPKGPWLTRMLVCKPRILVATALANKMARIVWALMTKKENYRDPAAAVA